MNTFSVALLCVQACLVQNVLSQCTSRAAVAAEPGLIGAPYNMAGAYGMGAYDGLAGYGMGGMAPFGYGTGYGELAYPAAAGWTAPYGAAAPYGAGAYGAGAYGAGVYGGAYGAAAPYGGAGEGNVAVAGELPVAGTTAVAGQVPIMGAVNFGGAVPAAGTVSIAGQCACGCGSPYNEYLY